LSIRIHAYVFNRTSPPGTPLTVVLKNADTLPPRPTSRVPTEMSVSLVARTRTNECVKTERLSLFSIFSSRPSYYIYISSTSSIRRRNLVRVEYNSSPSIFRGVVFSRQYNHNLGCGGERWGVDYNGIFNRKICTRRKFVQSF